MILVLSALFYGSAAFANNLTISNVTLTDPDVTTESITIEFDVSWDNSWRNNLNYDGVWVFAKYSTDSGASWSHATLKTSGTNPSGFSAGTGTALELIIPSDKKGCFVQRSGRGQGAVSVTDVRMVWAWGTDGLDTSSQARIKVVGIEVVYMPTSSFYIGDGSGSAESALAFHQQGSDNTAVQIATSGKSITCDASGNDDIDTAPVSVDGDGGVFGNANFPTGYGAFYMMKYEISEAQWVDFFNMLTAAEKLNRDITGAGGKNSDAEANRNTVSWTSGAAATTNGDRACGYLSWMDLAAYADWSALRPMTELEYEKACRGGMAAAVTECAWGNSSADYAETISGAEDGTETITDEGANCCAGNKTFSGGSGGTGPLRGGIFAKSDTSRSDAGAGYYGVMELSGNLVERAVTLGNAAGRGFQGTHGDGALSSETSYEGNATNTDWPGIDGAAARGVTGAAGSGLRGGGWPAASGALLAASDRTDASNSDAARGASYGARCARTAP